MEKIWIGHQVESDVLLNEVFRRTLSDNKHVFFCYLQKKASFVKAHAWSKTSFCLWQTTDEEEGKQHFWKGSKFIVFTVNVYPPASTELQKTRFTRNINKLITKTKNIIWQSLEEFKKQEINCWNYTNTVLLKYTLNLFLKWWCEMIIFHHDLLCHVNNRSISVLTKNTKIQFQCWHINISALKPNIFPICTGISFIVITELHHNHQKFHLKWA